jgi:hypothetical protein
MFAKYDKWFEQTAGDPALRRAAIADLSARRALFFWGGVCSTLGAVGIFAASMRSIPMQGETAGVAGTGFLAVMMWILAIKYNSDLLVLKMVDQFYKDRHGNHTA